MQNNTNETITWEAPQLIETTFEETEGGTTPAPYEGVSFYQYIVS